MIFYNDLYLVYLKITLFYKTISLNIILKAETCIFPASMKSTFIHLKNFCFSRSYITNIL